MIIDYFKDFQLQDAQIALLEKYRELLALKNRFLNLVSYHDDKELIIKHFLDSAFLLKFIKFSSDSEVLDLGTGGGFPGIVLAIMEPQSNFTLVDATLKKVRAVKEMVEQLELKNVRLVTGRAEILANQKEWRAKFDFVLSRAVAGLPTLLEYCLPFLKVGGQCICYKSSQYQTELTLANNALKLLNACLLKVENYALPDKLGDRSLLFFKKIKATADKYPRADGVPKSKPL